MSGAAVRSRKQLGRFAPMQKNSYFRESTPEWMLAKPLRLLQLMAGQRGFTEGTTTVER